MNKTHESFLVEESPALSEEQALLQTGLAVRNLTHFVKNMLQMVGGSAEIAQTALQTGNTKCLEKGLHVLLPNLERLRRTILDLCEYSRIRPLQPAPCDLKTLLLQAQNDLPAALKEKRPALSLQSAPTLPAAHLDPDKIRQLFRHILIFLTDQNPPAVSAEIQFRTVSSEWLISFEWEGTFPDNPQGLFEPAEQKGAQWGTGLDLPLAARMVHLHQGRIETRQKEKYCLLQLHLPQQPY